MSEPELIDIDEVARICRAPKRTVSEKWAYKPGFPRAYKPGRQRFWDRAEIIAWLRKSRVSA